MRNLLYILLFPSLMMGQVLAVPDAVGHGRFATGGRGGSVIYVTNLNDSGAGSFDAACRATGDRNIIFRVAGTIEYSGSNNVVPIPFGSGNVSIWGQSAPGDGILIRNAEFRVQDDNVIMTHMRFRNGDEGSGRDGVRIVSFSGRNLSGFYFDHLSISWADDELLNMGASTYGGGGYVGDVTIANCIIGESIGSGYNTLLWQRALDVSFYRNFLTKGGARHIRSSTREARFEMINNYIYDFDAAMQATYENYVDAIGNSWEIGGGGFSGDALKLQPCTTNCPGGYNASLSRAYIDDNLVDGSAAGIDSDFNPYLEGSPIIPSNISEITAAQTKDTVLTYAGAYRGLSQGLDAIDQEFIDNAVNDSEDAKRGSISSGDWPTISSGTPYTDSDTDGMDDSWETSEFGDLDQDETTDFDSDGWTDLEEFMHYLGGYTASGGAVSVTGVIWDDDTQTIDQGETVDLSYTISPSNATNQAATYESSNTGVLSDSGTWVSEGSATLTVHTNDGDFTDDMSVTTNAAPAAVDVIVIRRGSNKIRGAAGNMKVITN